MTKECKDCGIRYEPMWQSKGIPRQVQPDKLIIKEKDRVFIPLESMRLEIISEYLYNTLKRKQSILRDNDKSVVQFIQQEIDMIPLDLRKKGDKHNAT
jgi:hypothetical protein|tara:strand:- start:197 stop:490 length:294 start_codon:yes stop_codon:yes gene_type:complete